MLSVFPAMNKFVVEFSYAIFIMNKKFFIILLAFSLLFTPCISYAEELDTTLVQENVQEENMQEDDARIFSVSDVYDEFTLLSIFYQCETTENIKFVNDENNEVYASQDLIDYANFKIRQKKAIKAGEEFVPTKEELNLAFEFSTLENCGFFGESMLAKEIEEQVNYNPEKELTAQVDFIPFVSDEDLSNESFSFSAILTSQSNEENIITISPIKTTATLQLDSYKLKFIDVPENINVKINSPIIELYTDDEGYYFELTENVEEPYFNIIIEKKEEIVEINSLNQETNQIEVIEEEKEENPFIKFLKNNAILLGLLLAGGITLLVLKIKKSR